MSDDELLNPWLSDILADGHAAGYALEEMESLSGAWIFDDPDRGLRCHRKSDYHKIRAWWLWRFHPEIAKARGVHRPPVRFDPKEAGWDRLLHPPEPGRGPRFE